jgi:hypothetical protein
MPHVLSEGSSTNAGLTPEAESALVQLSTLDERPISEHVEVFEAIHASLRSALNRPTDA